MPDSIRALLQPDAWPTFVLISARMGGLMFTAPLWSMSAMPVHVRAAVTVVLSAALLPMAPLAGVPAEAMDIPLPLVQELAIGLGIGLTAAVLVQAAAMAGEVISLQMGLSLGPAIAPTEDAPTSPIAQLEHMLALLVYVSVGGHLVLFEGLAQSLHALPPGSPVALDAGGAAAVGLAGALFDGAVRAAAPVMVTLLLTNVAMAILNRAVPQLNAMMLSFPLTIGVGLLMIGAALPVTAGAMGGWMAGLAERVAVVVDAFQTLPR